MPGKSNITTDHEQIRRWVEERGGHPAAVTRTRGGRGTGNRTLRQNERRAFPSRHTHGVIRRRIGARALKHGARAQRRGCY